MARHPDHGGHRARKRGGTMGAGGDSAVILLGGLVAFLSAFATPYDSMGRLSNGEAVAERSLGRLAALDGLAAAVWQVETSSHRYVLSGDEQHLLPFRSSRERIPRLLEDLRAGTPRPEWNRIVALDRLIDDRVRVAEASIATRRRFGLEATRPMIESGHAEHVSDMVRGALGRLEREARAEQSRAGAARQSLINQARLSIVGGCALAFAAMLASLLMARRESAAHAARAADLPALFPLPQRQVARVGSAVARGRRQNWSSSRAWLRP